MLFLLAQNASALSISKYSQEPTPQHVNTAQNEQQVSVDLDSHQPQHLFNLPRFFIQRKNHLPQLVHLTSAKQ